MLVLYESKLLPLKTLHVMTCAINYGSSMAQN